MRTAFFALTTALLLAGLCVGTVSAQPECGNITLYTDETFSEVHTDGISPPYVDGVGRACGKLFVNTDYAPYNCYNITVTKITICSGTHQDLLLYDPSDPMNTGCHTALTDGILRRNILYDVANPSAVLAAYNPNVEILGPNTVENLAQFCFDVHKLTEFNYIVEVDWVYEAISCPLTTYRFSEVVGVASLGRSCITTNAAEAAIESSHSSSSSSSSTVVGDTCPDPPPRGCGCDCIEGSTKAWDACGACRLRLVDGVVPVIATFRDFQPGRFSGGIVNPDGHPDFNYLVGSDPGITETNLVPDGNGIPVYGNHPFGTTTTHSSTLFAQWWFYIPFLNIQVTRQMNWTLVAGSTDKYGYCVTQTGDPPLGDYGTGFFPIDNDGFGNQGDGHNYFFTMSTYLEITYVPGGRQLNFSSQDDMWVFINGTLVVDLGGSHLRLSSTLDLDTVAATLGLVPYQTYPMAIFFANRESALHATSTFCAETILTFDTQCATTAPPPTTTPPPTTSTPPPTTTAPPPTTTEPPTTTPVLTTTAPPPTTTVPPTTTPPPTTAPPPPTNGTGTCGSVYHVGCKMHSKFIDFICVPNKSDVQPLPIILGALGLFFGLLGLLLLFIFRMRPTSNKVHQDVIVDIYQGDDGNIEIGAEASSLWRSSPPAQQTPTRKLYAATHKTK